MTKNNKKSDTEKEVNHKRKIWFSKSPALITYGILFLSFFIFCTFIYGDVFTRAEQESIITLESEVMRYLLEQKWGELFWISRWGLLCYKSTFLGGLLLSMIFTLITYLNDKTLKVSRSFIGISSILPFLILAWMVWRGTSLYYKNEPSMIVLIPLITLIFSLIIFTVIKIIRRRELKGENQFSNKTNIPWGLLSVTLCSTILYFATLTFNQNEIILARMQLKLQKNDMIGLVEEGQKAKRPTKMIAAYYAIGLQQTNQILEHLFDIPFNYPESRLDMKDGNEEYGVFLADCNFYSGLMNASYRCSMDQIVMHGPRLYYLKRMVACAVMLQEYDLANKYLNIIEKTPFENEFVKKYRTLSENPEEIQNDPSLKSVIDLFPLEKRFEQNYRSPAFLGYNVGMTKGNNEALPASIAACLYSKDLPNAVERAAQLKIQNRNIPLAVQEAISIHGRKRPEVFKYFPELSPNKQSVISNGTSVVNSFIMSIQNYYQNKYNGDPIWRDKMILDLKGGVPEELRKTLEADWLGHYVFYYYCENIKPKQEQNKNMDGVN